MREREEDRGRRKRVTGLGRPSTNLFFDLFTSTVLSYNMMCPVSLPLPSLSFIQRVIRWSETMTNDLDVAIRTIQF